MNLYDAVIFRTSTRHFRTEALDKKTLEQILDFTKYLDTVSDSYSVHFEIMDPPAFKKTNGGAFSIKAPHYLIFSPEKKEGSLIHCGYLMEYAALYLVTKGIASCFMELVPSEAKKERFVLAFGKTDKNLLREPRLEKRLDLEELCTFKEETDANVMAMLQAARLAPSAINSQPWRYVVYSSRIHVFCKKDRGILKKYKAMKQLDIGMALANMLIAAEEMWLDTKVIRKEELAERSFEKNDYICTVVLEL